MGQLKDKPSKKPGIGLILLRAEWFENVVALPDLAQGMEADLAEIQDRLRVDLSIEATWVI